MKLRAFDPVCQSHDVCPDPPDAERLDGFGNVVESEHGGAEGTTCCAVVSDPALWATGAGMPKNSPMHCLTASAMRRPLPNARQGGYRGL